MKSEAESDHQQEALPNLDGRVFGKNGEPDVFIVGNFFPKLVFFVFAWAMFFVGVWDLWAPISRIFWGEAGEGRITHVIRESPGEELETIRVRREIQEGDYPYDTIFRHFVEVVNANGEPQSFEMAVASRQRPYALVNESFRIVYFSDEKYAYGVYQHRTWAFGSALILMGGTFIPLTWFLLSMVGRAIPIDAEDPEQLELERQVLEREQAFSKKPERGVS